MNDKLQSTLLLITIMINELLQLFFSSFVVANIHDKVSWKYVSPLMSYLIGCRNNQDFNYMRLFLSGKMFHHY
jgi:hypothetical protein